MRPENGWKDSLVPAATESQLQNRELQSLRQGQNLRQKGILSCLKVIPYFHLWLSPGTQAFLWEHVFYVFPP